MAALTVVAANVAAVQIIEQATGVSAADVTRGTVVRLDVSTGKYVLASGDNAAKARACGIVVTDALAGLPFTIVKKGIIDMGAIFGDATYDDDVYLSDTVSAVDGLITLTAGESAQTKIIGQTVPGWGSTTPDKLLRVDL